MVDVIRILHTRKTRKNNPRSRNIFGLGLSCALIFSLGLVFVGLLSAVGYAYISVDLPPVDFLQSLIDPPNSIFSRPTEIYDRTGNTVIYTLSNINARSWQYVSLDPEADIGLSDELAQATVAIFDPTFWTNPGFSLTGLIKTDHRTIAQRLIDRFMFPEGPKSFKDYITSSILAAQITHNYGREKILEWFLNSSYFGNLVHGVESAAHLYFNKRASQLDLAESALLVALIDSPALNPIDAPDAARNLGEDALHKITTSSNISTQNPNTFGSFPLSFKYDYQSDLSSISIFANYVLDQVGNYYNIDVIRRGGFKIISTLDLAIQSQVTCTSEIQLIKLHNDEKIDPSDLATACPASRLLTTLPHSLDELSPQYKTNTIVIEPGSGEILAMSGDPENGLDPSTKPGHPPGTILTPFIYLTAFTRGYQPSSLVWDLEPEKSTPTSGYYPAQGPLRLRLAMANDYINPAIDIMTNIGPDIVWRTMRQLGISRLDLPDANNQNIECPNCDILMDGGDATLMELTHAYSTLSNHGLLTGIGSNNLLTSQVSSLEPVSLLSIFDERDQYKMIEIESESRLIITEQYVYLINNILQDESARWSTLGHPNSLEIGRPAAVKLGKTKSGNNAWTIGFTQEYVIGVWSGAIDNGSSDFSSKSGDIDFDRDITADIASGLWHALIQYLTNEFPVQPWPIPNGINVIDVCDPSGMLPTDHCPAIVTEVFLSGSEPPTTDDLFQVFQINKETNHLATIFTPPELIIEKVFMIVPAKAQSWALNKGLEQPPETFDLIYTPSINHNVKITAPSMFSYVKGITDIIGTVNPLGFLTYRMQVGEGLNPTQWFQLADDSATKVNNEILGRWDTTALSGLYTIQVVVINDQNVITTATVQVTVDNENPVVEILHPFDSETYTYDIDKLMTFRVSAEDNVGIASVDFYLEDRLLISQSSAPYAIGWPQTLGEKNLSVVATDLAGNVQETAITFRIER